MDKLFKAIYCIGAFIAILALGIAIGYEVAITYDKRCDMDGYCDCQAFIEALDKNTLEEYQRDQR